MWSVPRQWSTFSTITGTKASKSLASGILKEPATPSSKNPKFSLLSPKPGIMKVNGLVVMALDRNPRFGKDASFSEGARRVADMLWETCGNDPSSFPKSYLENLRHEYSDGRLSMLELIDRVDLGPNATYEDYCEAVDALIAVDYSTWPHPDDVVEIPYGHLIHEIDPSVNYSEVLDFADEVIAEAEAMEAPGGEVSEEVVAEEQTAPDPLSDKMELFFKKVISSVYMDGVTEVTDAEGNPPNQANNYLMSPDGKSFSGIFYDSPPNDQAKQFPFSIQETDDGKWKIKY